MLGRKHHRIYGHRVAIIIVAEGNLAFGIGAEEVQLAGLSNFRLFFHQPVRVDNRRRHKHIGFIGSIAEHHALVTGALLLVLAFIHSRFNVLRLLADGIQNRAGCTVEPHLRTVVTNVQNDAAAQLLQVNPGGGGDFTGDNDHSGLHQSFAGDPCVLVFGDDRIEDGIGYLVCHLVRVSCADGLGGKSAVYGHESLPDVRLQRAAILLAEWCHAHSYQVRFPHRHGKYPSMLPLPPLMIAGA